MIKEIRHDKRKIEKQKNTKKKENQMFASKFKKKKQNN